MKKLLSLIPVLIVLCFAVVSHADMDAPDFTYDVYVGLSGWNVEMNHWTDELDENDEYIIAKKTVTLSPGTKITIRDYGEGYYEFTNPNCTEEYANDVTKEEIEKYTIEVGEIIGKEVGTACESVDCKVNTDDSDLSLRIGPSKGFPSVCGIPKDTELTYETTYQNGDTIWAFVSYNGNEGWVNTDYLAEMVEEEAVEAALPKDEPEAEQVGMSKTEIIIISVVGALILALTALLIILIIKRRNGGRS